MPFCAFNEIELLIKKYMALVRQCDGRISSSPTGWIKGFPQDNVVLATQDFNPERGYWIIIS